MLLALVAGSLLQYRAAFVRLSSTAQANGDPNAKWVFHSVFAYLKQAPTEDANSSPILRIRRDNANKGLLSPRRILWRWRRTHRGGAGEVWPGQGAAGAVRRVCVWEQPRRGAAGAARSGRGESAARNRWRGEERPRQAGPRWGVGAAGLRQGAGSGARPVCEVGPRRGAA